MGILGMQIPILSGNPGLILQNQKNLFILWKAVTLFLKGNRSHDPISYP
jgi:hypothetical protein